MFSKSPRIDRLTVGSRPTTAIPRLALLAGSLALAFTACAGSSNNNGAGGSNSSGGNSSGGSNAGGSGSGGKGSGGSGSGGNQSGGNSAGGSGSGGTSAKGGSSAGGSAGSSGGAAGSSGGSAGSSGGAAGSAGSSAGAGGSAGSGGGSSGSNPAGWYMTKDWSVTSADWHGCVWTGIDTVASTTTTISPQDFTAVAKEGGPYEVSGKVNMSYQAVALLGFNLNEPITGKSDQCKYNAASATAAGPANTSMATITKTYAGLAVNWSAKTKPGQFRIQLQGPDSATNMDHSWCVTVSDAQGPSFVKWSDFYAYCWDLAKYPNPGSDNKTAIPYKNEDIDAISFLVPGNGSSDTAFDFSVGGFAPGNSASDAPGPAAACGQQTGALGSTTTASKDASMARQAVTDTNCKKYILFNNNWGQPTSTIQITNYAANSFTVQSSQAATSGQGVPGSFPSIYVGANGDLAGGTFNTWSDTGLPKQISQIQSAQTTFTWSGKSGGNYNAAYDIWFSKSQPTAGAYNDAISGFIMVWLYKPGANSPIGGSSKRSTGTIAGHKWDVWVGVRGNTSTGTDDANRPVVSYVVQDGPVNTLTFDIKYFMNDAVQNASADKSSGGTSQAFDASWYLTDVFAGFEAWSGGDIVGNKAQMSVTI